MLGAEVGALFREQRISAPVGALLTKLTPAEEEVLYQRHASIRMEGVLCGNFVFAETLKGMMNHMWPSSPVIR
jgi:hypothetical protein